MKQAAKSLLRRKRDSD